MKNKKKYALKIGANYNSKKDEWNFSLGVNIDYEQENDSFDLLESSEKSCLLEEDDSN